MSSTSGMIVYLVFIIAIFYFMAIRPQSKEKKKQAELMATVAVGDSVLTSSGFYGVIIDMTDDTVIVEFGSNRNCRIPMKKAAIQQVEKQNEALRSDLEHQGDQDFIQGLARDDLGLASDGERIFYDVNN